MKVVKIEELATAGIIPKSTENFDFRGREYHVGPTFSLKMRSTAISFSKQQESQGRKCLLIERTDSVTVCTSVKKSIAAPVKENISTFDRDAFIERCRQELTKSIGPMASLIIDELVNNPELPDPLKIVDWIVTQIPDPRLAEEFKRKIG